MEVAALHDDYADDGRLGVVGWVVYGVRHDGAVVQVVHQAWDAYRGVPVYHIHVTLRRRGG